MESSMKLGLMTVFAVSGSMVLLFHQANKHLFNNFMKKFEYEIRGSTKHHTKKKVRFAKDVVEVPMENKSDLAHIERTQEDVDVKQSKHGKKLKDVMPTNRIVLYKGIMNDRKERFGF
ncbi:hypothetical protein Fmac_020749 [Flemingia macrophylla]|uniref:Uncharacterized protein n=1 Tax=Flemingia macrophylla TaxID=520843 RepID=A0ABD1LUX7_9FABA